jgi:nucleoid-associated protein YgaU
MHRDVKIGLILGVALVAVIAALFFRRETVDDETPGFPSESVVAQRRAIDERIERRSAAPYLQPLEPLADRKPAQAGPELARTTSPTIPPPALESQPVVVATVQPTSPERPTWVPIAGTRPEGRQNETTSTGPKATSTRRHRIERGDTLYDLAERYWGDGNRYALLFEVNRALLNEPDRLPLGAEIVIPEYPDTRSLLPTGTDRAETPSPPAQVTSNPFQPVGDRRPRRYTVERGDTLIAIARQVYGDGRQYRRIYEANRSRLASPDHLVEATVLEIP